MKVEVQEVDHDTCRASYAAKGSKIFNFFFIFSKISKVFDLFIKSWHDFRKLQSLKSYDFQAEINSLSRLKKQVFINTLKKYEWNFKKNFIDVKYFFEDFSILISDDEVIGGIREDIHFCAGGNGKDTCQV